MTESFNEQSYRTGVWVGRILGSVQNGCRSAAGTWPEDATEEHRNELIEWGKILGLNVTFDGRFFTIEDSKKPTLTVVN